MLSSSLGYAAKCSLTAYKPHGIEAEKWAIEPTLVRVVLKCEKSRVDERAPADHS